MSDLMGIGVRGLIAFQTALQVTGQNITNAKTAFYTRRVIDFSAQMRNNGVAVSDVRRVFDDAAAQNLQVANSNFSASQATFSELSQLEVLLDDKSNSINNYLGDAIETLRQLSKPNSAQGRDLFLQKLGILSNRFKSVNDQMAIQAQNIVSNITTATAAVNEKTAALANINTKLSGSNSDDTADLLDQQQRLLQELATYVDYSVQRSEDGEINVMLGNGTLMVYSGQAYQLATAPDPSDPTNVIINLQLQGTNVKVNDLIRGGQIAGLYQAQTSLNQARNGLGRLSMAITNTINQQNQLGVDAGGRLGGQVFNDINDPSLLVQRTLANSVNTGSATMGVSITDMQQVTTSDYVLSFGTSASYVLTRKSDKTVVASGSISSVPQSITADGFSIDITSGTFNSGDSYTIAPTRNMANAMNLSIKDPNLIALAWPVNAEPAQANQGKGQIEVTEITDVSTPDFSTPSELTPPLRIRFLSPTSYQIENATTSAIIEGPLPYDPTTGTNVFPTPGSYDPGYRIKLTGTIAAGDTFGTTYNSAPAGDNRNAIAMEHKLDSGQLQNGQLTLSQGYNLLTNTVSVQTNSAKTYADSGKVILEAAGTRYAQISEVSMAEESTNFSVYQEAYLASSQIIQVAKTILETIIGIGRG